MYQIKTKMMATMQPMTTLKAIEGRSINENNKLDGRAKIAAKQLGMAKSALLKQQQRNELADENVLKNAAFSPHI